MRDYKDDLNINKFALDDACVEHPASYDYWSTKETDAQKALDDAKVEMDATRADVELEIRSLTVDELNVEFELNLTKMTEDTIKALLSVDSRVRDAILNVNILKHSHAIFRTARKSFEAQGSRLDNLVKLHGQGYFNTPTRMSVPRAALSDAISKEVITKTPKGKTRKINKEV